MQTKSTDKDDDDSNCLSDSARSLLLGDLEQSKAQNTQMQCSTAYCTASVCLAHNTVSYCSWEKCPYGIEVPSLK